MYKKLYIIGNGFDIHHGIPSRYSDYRVWLEDNNVKLIDELREIYDVDSETWWNEFELKLGSPDLGYYIDKIAEENQPDFSSDDFLDRDYNKSESQAENEIGGLVTSVRKSFADWIASFPQPSSGKKISLDKTDALFINFNYTNTLQRLYNVSRENILFIHGNVGIDDLVLGHNKTYKELINEFSPDLPTPPSDLKGEELYEWYEENGDGGEDYIHQTIREASVREVCDLRKDTDRIIKSYEDVFRKLHDVCEIYIYGWSFSPIDLPYLDKIISVIDKSNVVWKVSYYSDNDKGKANKYFQKQYVDPIKVEYVQLKDLQIIRQVNIKF